MVVSLTVTITPFIRGFLTAKTLGVARGSGAQSSQAGLHRFPPHPGFSLGENENDQESFNELLMI